MTLFKGPVDPEDQDAIILDARCGDLQALQETFTTLIDPCTITECRDSESGSTALHAAAANGHTDVVRYLLGLVSSANNEGDGKVCSFVNATNTLGNTALHWAALNGQLETVQLLCEQYKADPFIRNKFNHDAIFEAEHSGKEEVENYFLKQFDMDPNDNDIEDDKEGAAVEVQISKGTEIEAVTKEAEAILAEKTQNISLE